MDNEIRGYVPSEVEEKWQARWEERGTNRFTLEELRTAENPFYNLMMFPYPSAEGLHVGNIYAFTGADVYGRYQRLLGRDVFEPIGFDAFGIHSENFALKVGSHPHGPDPQQRPQLHATVAAHGRHVRLGAHGRHHPPVLLSLDAVGLPAAVQGGAGRAQGGSGQLVSRRA